MKALSLKQPWADAVLYGGKRIENRVKWRTSNFRGEFLIHTSAKMTRKEYVDVVDFLEERGLSWQPAPPSKLVLGALVGRAKIVGVVTPEGMVRVGSSIRRLEVEEKRWWMNAFALVLDEIFPFSEPIACKGMLGWFSVPYDREGKPT